MEPDAVLGMAFTLILTGMIGGFILLRPLSKQLGAYLELRLKRDGDRVPADAVELRQLAETVRGLEAELRALRERQEFTDNLLARREPPKLPADHSIP